MSAAARTARRPAGTERLPALLALLVAALLLPAPPAAAQARDGDDVAAAPDETRADAGPVLRVFEIRYRDVSEVSLLIADVLSPDAVFEMNAKLRTVTVRDRADIVRQVADFIRRFDVPPNAAVVRIVVEKALRLEDDGDGDVAYTETAGWSFERLADATLEVLERGRAVQVLDPDSTIEIRVALDSIDLERRLMNVSELRVTQHPQPGEDARPRELLSTPLELEDRIGKVVMATSSQQAEEGLVVRVVGLIRERPPADGGER